MRTLKTILLTLLVGTLPACQPDEAVAGDGEQSTPKESSAKRDESSAPAAKPAAAASSPEVSPEPSLDSQRYPWLSTIESGDLEPLAARFPTPAGFRRVDVRPDSFAEFLRGLPVYRGRRDVHAYDGRVIRAPSAAVVAIDVGERNLQQCADTAIRLHAEFLWATDRRDEIAYHFTSGDRSAWQDWAAGERFRVSGANVDRVETAAKSESRKNFRAYLDHVFMYAGTRSLGYDSDPADTISPGSFFVAPGSPGHAVIVLDVAENDEGRRIALLGQGFMPAQELHVLRGDERKTVDAVWWELPDDGERLDTPSWEPFRSDDARTFRTPS